MPPCRHGNAVRHRGQCAAPAKRNSATVVRVRFETLLSPHSPSQVQQHIAYAYLDDELFELLDNHTVRELLRAALLERTRITSEEMRTRLQVRGWDWLECEACVQDYFQMLGRELRSERYNKTAHPRTLMAKLRNRPDGSVEYKHQNISVILVQLGLPYISGPKPRFNHQAQLRKVVPAHLAGHGRELQLVGAVREAGHVPCVGNWDGVPDTDLPEPMPPPEPLERKHLARHGPSSEVIAGAMRLSHRSMLRALALGPCGWAKGCLIGLAGVGGGGGSRTRVRGFAAIGSTCLGSVYCFNRKRPGGQGAVGEPGRF